LSLRTASTVAQRCQEYLIPHIATKEEKVSSQDYLIAHALHAELVTEQYSSLCSTILELSGV